MRNVREIETDCLYSVQHMQQHLDRISQTFSRPVTGIHNHTYGPLIDMLQPTLMTMFNMNTKSSITLQTQLRDALLSHHCKKVVVIAHGTGAAVLSQILDRLLCDMPMDTMSKLEIYTFGSAARHMSNPCLQMERMMDFNRIMGRDATSKGLSMMTRMEEYERAIPVCSHDSLI